MLDAFFNTIFGKIIEKSPFGAVLLISLIITLITTLAYKYFTNQQKLKVLKEEMDSLRTQMKESKNDTQKMMEIQKQSFQKSMEQMKHAIKPMLITFLPIIILFTWLQTTYAPVGNLLGPLNWLWVYILSSLIFSIALRKLLKVY